MSARRDIVERLKSMKECFNLDGQLLIEKMERQLEFEQDKCDHLFGYLFDGGDSRNVRISQVKEYIPFMKHDDLFNFCPDCGKDLTIYKQYAQPVTPNSSNVRAPLTQ